jgi:hypothetical protein
MCMQHKATTNKLVKQPTNLESLEDLSKRSSQFVFQHTRTHLHQYDLNHHSGFLLVESFDLVIHETQIAHVNSTTIGDY